MYSNCDHRLRIHDGDRGLHDFRKRHHGGSTAWGGGIYNDSQCTLTLTDSTVSGNTAYVGGGIANLGALIVNDSTVAQNFASDSPGGGGIYASSGTVAIANSIVAGNHNGTCPDIYGAVSQTTPSLETPPAQVQFLERETSSIKTLSWVH